MSAGSDCPTLKRQYPTKRDVMSAGSDCHTLKRQYPTKRDAIDAAGPLRMRRGRSLHAFKCPWCECYHTGHQKSAHTSKGRQRR
jgi:hypothetical protein